MRRKLALGLAAAIAWSVALLVGALTFPFYTGVTTSVACPGCPEVVSPLLLSSLVAVTLWSGRPSKAAAWVFIGLLWLLTLAGMLDRRLRASGDAAAHARRRARRTPFEAGRRFDQLMPAPRGR